MPVCSASGLYYEWSGPGRGPVLIFSHSLGTTLEMWQPQMDHFRDHFRILRYDARGHGRSKVPAGPYTIEAIGQDVLALAAELHIEQAFFCGLSMGGVVGQWLGAHAPQLVKKLILCDTAARIGGPAMWNERIAAAERDGMQTIASGVIPRWFTQAFVDREPQTVTAFKQMMLATSPAGYAATCAALRDGDMQPYLSAILMPTLILYGDQDPVTTQQDAQVLATHIEDSTMAGLPAAHLANVEAAKQFNEQLQTFLSAEEGRHGR